MKNNQIENHFHLNKNSFDGFIDIYIECQDKIILEDIIDSVIFKLQNYALEAYPIERNNNFVKRRIFFKKNLK